MPDENATVLELAAILGEAIARAHLAGKNANAPGDDDRGVGDYVLLTDGETVQHEDYNTTHKLP